MAKVVDIERVRVGRLADELVSYLERRGSMVTETSAVENVDRWRRAARRAGRRLGWRVRTGVSPDGTRVWAASQDFPVSLRDQRAAIEGFTASLLGPERPRP